MVEICQEYLPYRPWETERGRKLPGVAPIEAGEWLLQDEAYAAQMAHRVGLMAEKGDAVVRVSSGAMAAARELLRAVLAQLAQSDGFDVSETSVLCPDQRRVEIDYERPLECCGALVQEDLVIMEKIGVEHVLTGAVLCFPASWTLAEKFMKPMTEIHVPVAQYTADIAKRVQRLFDGIQVDRPIWRANYLVYGDPELHQPRREDDRRSRELRGEKWLRVERQGMRRLPETNAVIFSVHSYVVREARVLELGLAMPEPSGH